MILRSVVLQHFRSYSQQKFDFDPNMTIVVGINTAGKTNLTEALQLLSSGKSFRGQSDKELVQFDQDIGRVQGLVEENQTVILGSKATPESDKERSWSSQDDNNATKLEAVVLTPDANNGRWGKKF